MAATFLKAVSFCKLSRFLSLSYGNKMTNKVCFHLIELNLICVYMLPHSLRLFDIQGVKKHRTEFYIKTLSTRLGHSVWTD